MNEADSVFANEDSLVEVPSVEPSCLRCLNVKSMIPGSHGILMNDMKEATCYMQYDMYYVYDVVCCVCNMKSMMMYVILMTLLS